MPSSTKSAPSLPLAVPAPRVLESCVRQPVGPVAALVASSWGSAGTVPKCGWSGAQASAAFQRRAARNERMPNTT